jgi:hypothetical protein
MQISASTLLASQQASQHVSQVQAKPATGFVQALDKAPGFQPLPLKQAAPAENVPSNILQPASAKPQKPGSTIDIKV